jgi:LAO/AO transport system kinase
MSESSFHKKGQSKLASEAARKDALHRIRSAQLTRRSPEAWAAAIQQGDRDALSQAITLSESNRLEDLRILTTIFNALKPITTKGTSSNRIGITGVPGVGKSTFIEAFGHELLDRGHRVAVLAIDPSSSRSGGSLMGDKTRMNGLSNEALAFVRPSPTSTNLGGVARGTYEAILLCEAAGFDRILVETVGVGQSETAVRDLTDAFILLMLPGGGDELQGIKRGIMEMADLLVINKDDGGNRPLARETASQYEQALRLFPPTLGGHTVQVHTTSALEKHGIDAVVDAVDGMVNQWSENGWFGSQRQKQRLRQLDAHVHALARIARLNATTSAESSWIQLQQEVVDDQRHPLEAAQAWSKLQTAQEP